MGTIWVRQGREKEREEISGGDWVCICSGEFRKCILTMGRKEVNNVC